MNLDTSKASGPDSIPVGVLKNCEPELSYILAYVFNMCLKESCSPDCWKSHRLTLYLRMLEKGLLLKTTALLVFELVKSVISKVFEKLVNNRIVDHLQKCSLFSDFQFGFRSSRSTADLLTVVSDRIARAFNRSGATRTVALDISKVIGGFEWLWMGIFHKNINLKLEFLKAPFLVIHFSYYTLMTFLMMLSVILLSMLMMLLSTLNMIRHLICGNN